MVVTGFSPLGHASYLELGMSKETDSAMLSPKIAAIAEKHGKTPAQVILRWNVQRDVVIIPKSSSPARMRENLDVLSWSLDEDEMAVVESHNLNRRFNDPVDFCQGAFNTFAPLYN
jgi:D-xylose reductase